jgi:integral membrane protein
MSKTISLLRTLSLIEGVTTLLLFGVAMPLKYAMGMPMAVKIVGWIHGIFFILLCLALIQTTIACRWPITRSLGILIAALIPFGAFLMDKRIKAYGLESAAPGSGVALG